MEPDIFAANSKLEISGAPYFLGEAAISFSGVSFVCPCKLAVAVHFHQLYP